MDRSGELPLVRVMVPLLVVVFHPNVRAVVAPYGKPFAPFVSTLLRLVGLEHRWGYATLSRVFVPCKQG